MPKIFLSWSGDVSHSIARSLNDWLPVILQNVVPFISSEDLRKGGRWNADLSDELEQTKFGIICLTPDNLNAPWILFEAGAISRVVSDSHVAPFLVDVKPSEIPPPLTGFNATKFEKADFRRLINSINTASGADAVKDEILDRSFDNAWDRLSEEITKSIEANKSRSQKKGNDQEERRSTDSILQELLELSRNQIQYISSIPRDNNVDIILSRIDRVIEFIDRSRISESMHPAAVRDMYRSFFAMKEFIFGYHYPDDVRNTIERLISRLEGPVEHIYLISGARDEEKARLRSRQRSERIPPPPIAGGAGST